MSFSHFSLPVLFILFPMLGRALNTFHPGKQELSSMPDAKLTFFNSQADQCSRARQNANRFRNRNVAMFHKVQQVQVDFPSFTFSKYPEALRS